MRGCRVLLCDAGVCSLCEVVNVCQAFPQMPAALFGGRGFSLVWNSLIRLEISSPPL